MPPEESKASDKHGIIIRPSTGLVSHPNEDSPALGEIMTRSMVHIQTSKALGMRHRVGEQELFGPDYTLVCAFAEVLRMTPEEVLRRLLLVGKFEQEHLNTKTKIEDGRFKALRIDEDTLPVSSIPSIAGLVVESLQWWGLKEAPTGIDFSMFPHLTRLDCSDNQLTDLDLSQVPNLTVFFCNMNPLTKLDLSRVPNLMELYCQDVHLTELDLSGVPIVPRRRGLGGFARLIVGLGLFAVERGGLFQRPDLAARGQCEGCGAEEQERRAVHFNNSFQRAA